VVENEEANIPIYSWLYCVLTSGKRTSKSKKTFTVVINTSVEVRGYYHRVCVGITKRKEKE
jgi:hypothetical protein